ncbi:GSCFA domain-containing protein [Jannaschia rubra]|uniref:GSCFA domain-containing protein n=1 Tax=Jannaschia rubra TaxID=282197 RepID=UPI002490EBB2|nr:GSCFA domain-containing protein [Jannaschia rubra]
MPFRIMRKDRIVTAGSCFARHLAGILSAAGFNYHTIERAHPLIHPDVAAAHNYGPFSARYGNVYTARRLLQLIQRAYGLFTPLAEAWPSTDKAPSSTPSARTSSPAASRPRRKSRSTWYSTSRRCGRRSRRWTSSSSRWA